MLEIVYRMSAAGHSSVDMVSRVHESARAGRTAGLLSARANTTAIWSSTVSTPSNDRARSVASCTCHKGAR